MDFQLAREAQLLAMSQQQAKIEQESKDRKYAEDIAMQEVERFVRASSKFKPTFYIFLG